MTTTSGFTTFDEVEEFILLFLVEQVVNLCTLTHATRLVHEDDGDGVPLGITLTPRKGQDGCSVTKAHLGGEVRCNVKTLHMHIHEVTLREISNSHLPESCSTASRQKIFDLIPQVFPHPLDAGWN